MLLRKLRDYQVEAVAKARPHPGFLFALEQRTGKCLTSLALVDERKPKFLMIVTLRKGVRVWKEELKSSLKIDWPCRVVVTYFQELHKARKYWRERFRGMGTDGVFVICDESHFIKRRGSQPARTIRYLGSLAQWRLALTGTPLSPRSAVKRRKNRAPELIVTEGIEDAWSQFDFIDPTVFGSQEEFEATYLKMGGFRGLKIIGYRNKKKFQRLFHQYSYRKLLREVQEKVTKINRVKVFFKLTGAGAKVYRDLDRGMSAFVNGRSFRIPLMVTKTAKLQQAASGFLIDDEKRPTSFGTDKLGRAERLLRKIFSQGHGKKVVICAKFIHELDLLQRLCSRMGLSHQVIKGGVDYDGSFNVDVMLVQVQSGVAIDLAKADTFIFYSLSHRHTDYEQAKFRILSYDKQQARYYYLLAKGTVEELVYKAVTTKKNLVSIILDHYRRNLK